MRPLLSWASRLRIFLEKGVIEYIIPESRNHPRVFNLIRQRLDDEFARLNGLTPEELLKQRRARFRAF